MTQESRPNLLGQILDNRYQILDLIGNGSGASVFRARQLNVDRDVAVKVLSLDGIPEQTLPEVLARFENEARIISRLRHPHTIKLHDFGKTQDGRLYLVMEFLHGTPLDRLISQGPLDERATLRILGQVSEALAEAHSAGVIHRDLKPQNIFVDRVSEQQEIKVLDFGIAKVSDQKMQTVNGMVIGTPAYMSPEQAQGLPLDTRSDLYSLGVIAFQCLTGRLPFESDTPVGVLVKHVTEPPPALSSLEPPVKVSPGLEQLVLRLLAKRPEDRPSSAGEVRDIVKVLEHRSDETDTQLVRAALSDTQQVKGSKPQHRSWAWKAVLSLGVLALVGLVLWWNGIFVSQENAAKLDIAELSVVVTQLTETPEKEFLPSLSPDGKFVAFVSKDSGNARIYLLRLGGDRPILLTPDSKGDDYMPNFSPDGTQIAFCSNRDGKPGLYLMGATGESVRRIADNGFNPAWSPDGKKIYYATEGVWNASSRGLPSELWSIDLQSGQRHKVFEGDAVQPSVSPHDERIAFWAMKGGQRDIWTVGVSGGNAVPVTQDSATDYNPVWSEDGRYLFFLSDRSGTMNLWRVPIEERSGQVLGLWQPVTSGASTMLGFSLAKNGLGITTMITENMKLVRLEFDPEKEVLKTQDPKVLYSSSRPFITLDVSPDGSLVSFATFGSSEEIGVINSDGNGRRLLTNDNFKDRRPRFSPDGSHLVFYSNRSGNYEAWTIRTDGTGLEQATHSDSGTDLIYPNWTPDGRGLILADNRNRKLWRFSSHNNDAFTKGESLVSLTMEKTFFLPFDISPDGKRLLGIFTNLDSEKHKDGLVVVELAKGEVERLGIEGHDARWVPDGRRILSIAGQRLFLVDAVTKSTKEIFSAPRDSDIVNLAISSDGSQIFLIQEESSADLWLLDMRSKGSETAQ